MRNISALLLAASWCAWTPAHAADVRTGLDVLVESRFAQLKGKRVGLITNQTGRSRDGKSDVELLAKAPGMTLAAVFSPEHGFQGVLEEAQVSSDALKLSDGRLIPLYSLYGATLAPTAAMLAGLDALVFDIQDVGARFYTYSATMGMAMEAAGAANLEFYVLDRPNPINGDTIEGPVLDPEIRHFIAYFPIPIRHGMTLGEIALAHIGLDQVKVRLHVIAMKGWGRKLWYDQTGLPWIKPSPNMPDLDSATLYPGIACLEFTNLSVGRGTPHPFLWVGAPWLDASALLKRLEQAKLAGISFQLQEYTPTKSTHEGKLCRGIAMRITNREQLRPLRVFAHLICALRDLHPKQFELHWDQTKRMVGTEAFLRHYESAAAPERIIEMLDAGTRDFRMTRKPYLIY